jgi:hypothetical protein
MRGRSCNSGPVRLKVQLSAKAYRRNRWADEFLAIFADVSGPASMSLPVLDILLIQTVTISLPELLLAIG